VSEYICNIVMDFQQMINSIYSSKRKI